MCVSFPERSLPGRNFQFHSFFGLNHKLPAACDTANLTCNLTRKLIDADFLPLKQGIAFKVRKNKTKIILPLPVVIKILEPVQL